jgi:hypothetical protein
MTWQRRSPAAWRPEHRDNRVVLERGRVSCRKRSRLQPARQCASGFRRAGGRDGGQYVCGRRLQVLYDHVTEGRVGEGAPAAADFVRQLPQWSLAGASASLRAPSKSGNKGGHRFRRAGWHGALLNTPRNHDSYAVAWQEAE